MSIQTTASYTDNEFSVGICFNDSHLMSLDGLSRHDVIELRDCLDAILWKNQSSDYQSVLDNVQKTIGPYVSVRDEEIAAVEALQTIRELLLRQVRFSENDKGEMTATLDWWTVESMLTRPAK